MKEYILDSSVLLYDPNALFGFEDNNIIIPISVIEEIDCFKNDLNERGRNAREVSRILDRLRADGSLSSGVKLKSGGKLFVKFSSSKSKEKIPQDLYENKKDMMLLAVAMEVRDASELQTIFVTKDIYLRIKADALGMVVNDYESDKVAIEELYSGQIELMITDSQIKKINACEPIPCEEKLIANQYVTLLDEANTDRYAFGRFNEADSAIYPLAQCCRDIACRIDSRNKEQAFALDALLNEDIGLVTLVGKAGTGKTLLAVAASIYKTVDENAYDRILVSRPTLPMGQDIGYLPGTVEEKLTPWMYPIADNVELILRSESNVRHKIRGFKELVDMGILIIEPLTFIRGRSIHNQYLIVDEAQNLTPHEIKTIITRVGDGTKIILTGDPYQIDNPYIDSSSNGLTSVVEKFKKQQVAAHITLTKGERSILSELAANLL